MSAPAGLGGTLAVWAVANSVAGAAVGVALGLLAPGGFDRTVVAMSVLFGNVVGFTVLASTAGLGQRLRSLGPGMRATLLALALLSGSVAGTAAVLYAFPLYVLGDLRRTVAVLAINAALALVIGAVVHAYEAMRWRLARSLEEVQQARLAEARHREEAARAELEALQARINPHFFFNTLNTIASLVEDDPAAAAHLVHRLAGLFRYTLRSSAAGPVSLRDEIGFVREYLAIERARFGPRLRVVEEIDPATLDLPVPGLILQPIVENALAHGVSARAGGGTVTIRAALDAGRVRLEVEDDGPGPPATPPSGGDARHGLENVRRRVHALDGQAGGVHVLPRPQGQGTLVRIELPAAAAR